VAVNCAAVPETLMESELFGYTRGAFTDAKRNKPGRIAQADGGTLFLDEVGDLPISIQVKLLRFLQERVYEPLGATFSTRANVRIISATNRNLEQMVQEGSFRQDLYFRLNIMQIELPALHERPEDIPLLTKHFIQRFRNITGNKIDGIEQEAMAALCRHCFPGNIRELENVIERAFILCQGRTIKKEHLPESVLNYASSVAANGGGPNNGERNKGSIAALGLDPLQEAEKMAIVEALARNKSNRSRTASELGIHRTTLLRKLKRYGIT